ncbi:MAG: hypothetical protein NC245_09120 [Muribaculum sp.]|nr:hypothetical protein [Muribaculum sp.]
MVLADPEQVLIAILIGKHDVMAVPEKPQPDIRADAFQHKIGLSFDLKTKQYGFCGRTGEQQDTEDEKRSIPFMEEKDKSNKKAAGPDQKGQDQPPE